jgi:hypothetical protein
VRKSRQNDATFEKKQERKEEKNQKKREFLKDFCVPLMAVFTVCDMLFGRKRRTRIGQYLAKRWARALRDDRTRFFAIHSKRARDGSYRDAAICAFFFRKKKFSPLPTF